jgi:SRSO17 transposase
MATLPDGIRVGDLRRGLVAFHARFADLFARSEQRQRSQEYLRGLLGGVERRNGWQLAEHLGEATPDGTQRLLNGSRWSASDARDRLVEFCTEQFGHPEGILAFDETGFLKQGTKSAGVARQYSGTAGKVENCQVGVFASYVSPRGRALVDRGLYLPTEWTDDPRRCAGAGIPAQVTFRTKSTLALRMHHRLLRLGLPVRWVTADEVYGRDETFRATLAARGALYVLAVECRTKVWTEAQRVELPAPQPSIQGYPLQRARRTLPSTCVDALARSWPSKQWKRLAVHQGEKGPIEDDWAAVRVVQKHRGRPGGDSWLLVRRSVSTPTECSYYLSNAPASAPLEELAHVAASRYSVEQCFEEAKDDFGMDHYEVRTWTAWYRFMTLCMMALAWVASVRTGLQSRRSRSGPPSVPVASAPTSPRKRSRKKGGPAHSSHRGQSPRFAVC